MRSSPPSQGKTSGRAKPIETEAAAESWWPLLLLYLGLGAASGLLWARIADIHTLPSWHLQMISGTAPAPNQYRPLTPWLAEFVRFFMPDGDLIAAYFVVRSAATGVTLFFFDRYLRFWFTRSAAAAGALCLAATVPFTYFRVVQESDPINLLVFVLAFWALALGRDLWLIPLVLIGTLNREAVAMIPATYLVVRWGREQAVRLAWRTLVIGACWALVYGGMLMIYGRRGYYCDAVMLLRNVSSLLPTVYVFLVFGAIWVFAFMAWRQGPEMLRRALWLAPFYVALHYCVAIAQEVRVFLPLAPILIPLSWRVLFPQEIVSAGRSRQT
jgi:hypothetical protein